ncbi:SpoVR family protein [Marinivivus vitaminiproducens]|uniref:SpoVR family protein n=1 Tax=Marinivivus vitaminiproducens TaxID=3035935 RepID=UPI0027A3A230|nr:SpoVR family protein [Geminicoccaceae bacterium SCSIO 64248]
MTSWTIKDLEYWDDAIRERVMSFQLDCYPQEFEVCDHNAMLGYMAYHGMPARYPHWSFGKSFEKTKTMYDHGVSGLPYELVINSNPCLAYLMQDNSLLLQILTIAHVYGHNDFFKNNFTFTAATDAGETIGGFKSRADRVRSYSETPGIGVEKVEATLDAAHALSFNCGRNPAIRRLSRTEQVQRAIERARPIEDPFALIHKRSEVLEPDLDRLPLEPEEDLLLFIRDFHPRMPAWQRDLLSIVHEETRYFLPQMETKIMNEGWASTWHYRIMESLDLPSDLRLEFMVRHNQVVCPHAGSINPYHLGFHMWRHIERNFDESAGTGAGRDKMFAVRETDRDAAFIRRFLDEDLIRELDLFTYDTRGPNLVVNKVADEESWEDIKSAILHDIGLSSIPVIRITDADHGGNRALYLVHEHDGRDLHIGYAQKTLAYLHQLWGHRVLLETVMKNKKTLLSFGDQGFDAKLMR